MWWIMMNPSHCKHQYNWLGYLKKACFKILELTLSFSKYSIISATRLVNFLFDNLFSIHDVFKICVVFFVCYNWKLWTTCYNEINFSLASYIFLDYLHIFHNHEFNLVYWLFHCLSESMRIYIAVATSMK